MWSVHRIVNFTEEERLSGASPVPGCAFLGLHERDGSLFSLAPGKARIHCIDPLTGSIAWSVGPGTKKRKSELIPADLKRPSWISAFGDGTYLVCDSGRTRIVRIDPAMGSAEVFIDLGLHGAFSPTGCVFDAKGNIWVNDPGLARLWIFTREGKLLRMLGAGDESPEDGGVMRGEIPPEPLREPPAAQRRRLDDMDLAEVYDMRCGPDGLIYILEGGRLRLRVVDFERDCVRTVAGTGARGYTGDGGDPRRATFGKRRRGSFDGPWAFCLDNRGAIYVADSQSGVVRMIDRDRRTISTIAGGRRAGKGKRNDPEEKDPFSLTLPSIVWMDWGEGKLFISDEIGDLVVLEP